MEGLIIDGGLSGETTMSENMHTVTHINSNFARGIMDNGRSSVNDHERDLESRIIEIPLDTVWLPLVPNLKCNLLTKTYKCISIYE